MVVDDDAFVSQTPYAESRIGPVGVDAEIGCSVDGKVEDGGDWTGLAQMAVEIDPKGDGHIVDVVDAHVLPDHGLARGIFKRVFSHDGCALIRVPTATGLRPRLASLEFGTHFVKDSFGEAVGFESFGGFLEGAIAVVRRKIRCACVFPVLPTIVAFDLLVAKGLARRFSLCAILGQGSR